MFASCKNRRKVLLAPRVMLSQTSQPHLAHVFLSLLISIALVMPSESLPAAKMDPQLKWIINDAELLLQPPKPAQTEITESNQAVADEPDERFNLYRSELKRLSYETIHRILRDENEPIYRREDAEYRYYQKRSYQPRHEVVRRAVGMPDMSKRAPETPATKQQKNQHTLKHTYAQLHTYDAAHDYQGNHSTIYTLDLSNNQLQTIDLSAFTSLQRVNLSNNSLTAIPINHNEHALHTITTLNLNDNQISQASDVHSSVLRELHLSGNRITQLAQLNLSMLTALETLDLSCNRIAELETAFFPQRMHNLKHLNLAHNRIGTIYRETFYNLLSLNTLLLSYNNISDIDYETFLALPNLQYLDLSHNQLRGEAIRALQGIPDLVRLSIAYNPDVGAAMQEFVASWSLKELDASGTGLCQIPAALAQSVRTLKLTDNWLKIVNCGDLDSYPLLQYLDLSHSHIEDIEDDALGRLEIIETLFLDHNRLRKVPISLPTSLEHLFLQNNEIMDIQAQSFQGLNNLQTLDLSGNKLLYLPALPLPKLLTLNLRSAGLRGVSQAMVHTLPRLRDLLLDENPIKCSDLLSIAEWASPCRIVERGSGSGSVGDGGGLGDGNRTVLESYNIEGNGIMDDLSAVGEEAGDNRIGGSEQIISKITSAAAATAADKLGQQQLVDDGAEGLLATTDTTTASDIELKQKFVRMHNFFEKFRSNCGVKRQMVAGGDAQEAAEDENAARTPTPPTCAVEFEAGSGEQTTVESLPTVKHFETRGGADNLVVSSNLKSAKFNSQMPASKAQQQESVEVDSKTMKVERARAMQADSAWTRKAKKDGKSSIRAETKLFKFNQKNFTAAPTESSAELASTTIRTVGFDYKTGASIATTTTPKTENVASALPTVSKQHSRMMPTITVSSKIREFDMSSNDNNKSNKNNATTSRPTTVASANLLRQQISPTKTTTPATDDSNMMNTERASAEIGIATITTTQIPVTIYSRSDSEKQLNTAGRKTAITTAASNPATTSAIPIKLALAASAPLSNAQQYVTSQKSQQQHADIPNKASTTTIITTAITEAATASDISKITSSAAATPEEISSTSSNGKLTTTTTVMTTSAMPTLKPTTDAILLPAIAKYLQSKETQTHSSGHLAPQEATAQNVAATKLINVEEGLGRSAPPQSSQQRHENQTKETNIARDSDETTTTTSKSVQQLSSAAAVSKKSPAKQKEDYQLKQNDSKSSGHEMKAITTRDHETTEAEDTEVASVESLDQLVTKPKAITHIWQQHNFKRANPFPGDNFAHQPETKQTMEDVKTTEHTLSGYESETASVLPPPPPHKHEPLQLHIRDRHLIGTPLLMHRGDNMLVEAAEALRQVTVTSRTTTAKPTTKPTISLSERQTTRGGQQKYAEHRTDGAKEETVQSHMFVNQIQAVEAISDGSNMTSEHRNGSEHDEGQDVEGKTFPSRAVVTGRSTETTMDIIGKTPLHPTSGASSKSTENKLVRKAMPRKHDDIAGGGNSNRRKPTLIMKKMTIQTKHTQQTQMPHHHTLNTPRENEVMQSARIEARSDDARDALTDKLIKAHSEWHNNDEGVVAPGQPQHKHSTVNTPIVRDRNSHAHLLVTLAGAAAKQVSEAPKAQHSISNQHSADHAPLQLQERAALHNTQTQKWLGARHVDANSEHPVLLILLSFSLLALMLVGLMHVYRCDVLPWRRHLLAHQQRPHLQRQFHGAAGDDDVHSFLQYHSNGAGQHQQQQPAAPPRWHHGTRSRSNYSSPLHNLHVRELQKTSAVEVEPASSITRSSYDIKPYAKSARRNGSTASSASGGSAEISRHSSSSFSSTHSSCSAAATAAGMMDTNDTFYVEIAAECGQFSTSDAIHCDMLPMELLTAASPCQRDIEHEADTAVHETESLPPGDGMQTVQSVRSATDDAKQTTTARKLQQWRTSKSTLFNNKNGRSKRSAKAVSVSSSSSATSRKFDLW